ncbi:MAG: nucleotidyltransferase family protein [Woeseiaceae bacterium]
METIPNLHVVLQAGGEGRRIRSVDSNKPKPVLTVGGVSLIGRLLQQLASAGFQQFTVVTGLGGTIIQEHVEVFARCLPEKIVIDFYQEPRELGNAGAVVDVATDASTIMLVFADLFTEIDFSRLVEIHRTRGSDVTLASHWEEHRLTLGELQAEGSIVKDYVEKPSKKFLICSGIAVIEQAVLQAAQELPRPFGLSDLIQLAIKRSHKVSHWTHGSRWMDVNTPEALHAAETLARGDFLQENATA